jgi:drug/metabolite transporter (DMT)-like permease
VGRRDLSRIYLGLGGGALAFILWALALQRATPTQVANTMTINPLAAGLLAAVLVDEPITWNLGAGLVAVLLGIWIATTAGTRHDQRTTPRTAQAVAVIERGPSGAPDR